MRVRALLAGVLPLVAFLLSSAPAPVAAAGTLKVSGTVFDNASNPLAGASVELRDHATAAVLATVLTSSSGFYLFGSLGPGTYDLAARYNAGSVTLGQPGGPVTVSLTQFDAQQNLYLAPPATVHVFGRVLDGAGGVVPGQNVQLTVAGDQSRPVATAVSAADGGYSFYVAPGTYGIFLYALNATEVHAPATYRLWAPARDFMADTNLDLALPEYRIAVHISDTAGHPVAGAHVVTDQSDAANLPLAGLTASGYDWYTSVSYPLTDSTGTAVLWLFPNPIQHILTVLPSSTSGLAQTSFAFVVGGAGDVSVTVAPIVTLTGVVRAATLGPLPGQTVSLQRADLPTAPLATSTSDAAGNYAFSSLGAGGYTLGIRTLNTDPGLAAPQDYSIRTTAPLTLGGATSLDLVLPAVPVTVRVVGPAGELLSGIGLSTAESAPAPMTLGGLAATGTSAYAPGYLATSTAGTAGLWLLPGSYTVYAKPGGGSSYAAGAGNLDVAAGSPGLTLTIALTPAGSLHGRVTGPGGAGIGGQAVTATGMGQTFAVVTAPDGAYALTQMPAGPYTIVVNGSNGASAGAPPQYRLTLDGPVTVSGSTALDLPLPERRVAVSVTGAGAPLAGVGVTAPLVTVTGIQVAPGVTASGWIDSSQPGYYTTGPAGTVTLYAFPGTYPLTAFPTSGGWLPASRSVTVAGSDVAVALALYTPAMDTTPPLVSFSLSPALNAQGWANAPVTVTWSTSDPESGASPCAFVVVTAETPASGRLVTCTSTNGAGLTTTASALVRVDMTPPAVSLSGGGTYDVDAAVTLTCSASDALSGLLAPCSGSRVVDAATLAAGPNRFVATATDRAGNVGTAVAVVTVAPTGAGLCALTQRWVSPRGVGVALCQDLRRADDPHAGLADYVERVSGLSDRFVTAEHRAALLRWAGALSGSAVAAGGAGVS